MPVTSPELAAYIQRRIDELQPHSLGEWLVRVCKQELNALPIKANLIYLWALQPDGTVLCMDYEAFGLPVEPETDDLVLYAVLLHAARKDAELQPLVPPPPPDTRPCSSCESTGVWIEADGTQESCLGCSGLGWHALHSRYR
jgi:hypothetical protein